MHLWQANVAQLPVCLEGNSLLQNSKLYTQTYFTVKQDAALHTEG